MKTSRIFIILAIFCVTLWHAIPASAQFQGKVNYRITADTNNIDIAYAAKGNNMRFDLSKGIGPINGSMSAVINMEDRQAILLMGEQKMAMIMPIDNLEDMASQSLRKSSKKEKNADEVDVKRTGKTKSIAGHSCEQWTISSKKDGAVAELWVAKGLGNFGIFSEWIDKMPDWAGKFEPIIGKNGGLPMLLEVKGKKGKDNFKIEATSVTTSAVSDSEFGVPAGFQIIDQSNVDVEINEDEEGK
jgi:hypothetical protein